MISKDVLRTWWTLDEAIMGTDEAQAWRLLDWERHHLNRPRFVARLYSRYSMLRREREHKELGI